MSNVYPPNPPQPRRLVRSSSNKLAGGVCAGVAEYLNMDPNLVRILTVVATLFTGVPLVVYLVALFVLPQDNAVPPTHHPVNGPQPQSGWTPYGATAAQPPADPTWGPQGAPWEQPQAAAPATEAKDPTDPSASRPA